MRLNLLRPRPSTRLAERVLMSGKMKSDFVHAHSTVCVGEAGRTGDWRSAKPEIDRAKCTPSRTGRPSCFICWLYCPEAVVKRSVPVEIDLEYCKGCGICAEECPVGAIQMVDEKDG